jgi:hypothetical protein
LVTGLLGVAGALFRVLLDEDTQNPVLATTQVFDIHHFQPVGCGNPIRGTADLLNIQCHNCRFKCRGFTAKEKWAFAHSFLRVSSLCAEKSEARNKLVCLLKHTPFSARFQRLGAAPEWV